MPVLSAVSTCSTRDFLNQSWIGDASPGGVQYTGKHGMVLVSADAGIVLLTREQVGGSYWIAMDPPVSVAMSEIRGRYSGGAAGTRPSTRLSTSVGVKVTGGTAIDPEIDSAGLTEKEAAAKAAQIYERFGYWTTIPSAITCWALILDN